MIKSKYAIVFDVLLRHWALVMIGMAIAVSLATKSYGWLTLNAILVLANIAAIMMNEFARNRCIIAAAATADASNNLIRCLKEQIEAEHASHTRRIRVGVPTR